MTLGQPLDERSRNGAAPGRPLDEGSRTGTAPGQPLDEGVRHLMNRSAPAG